MCALLNLRFHTCIKIGVVDLDNYLKKYSNCAI